MTRTYSEGGEQEHVNREAEFDWQAEEIRQVFKMKCTKCAHDRHKCIWNGKTRIVVKER
jgi:hypothetical protein